MTNEEKINLIGQKMLILSNDLEKYQSELEHLRSQFNELQNISAEKTLPIKPESIQPETTILTRNIAPEPLKVLSDKPPAQQSSFNFEEFIGGKLISIIGIVILVIGLAIGVKYAIDRDLINPLSRIVLAYAAGSILLFIAFRLKQNYRSFSAVLLSGAMASLYFTTFAAYSMYGLFPQIIAFLVMVFLTAFTVFAATIYNLEVIGIIGLVGSYAVPMLLSEGGGKIHIMFAYMLIINLGILFLSFKRYWQILNHFAFGLSWLILGSWMMAKYDHEMYFSTIMLFSFLFFIVFYISNISYKIVKQEKFGLIDIIRLLSNSFIFFAVGYAALNNEVYESYLGIFTIVNALIHLIFSYIVFRNKLLDRNLFYLLIAMVLTFITMAVPVQLEGNWVTLFWSVEAALLFIFGRYRSVRFYEWLGIILSVLSVFSLLDDWSNSYFLPDYYFKNWQPVLNIHFLCALIFISSLATITYINYKTPSQTENRYVLKLQLFVAYLMPALLFLFSYLAFSNEISAYFNMCYERSLLQIPDEFGGLNDLYDFSWHDLKDSALSFFSLAFFSLITFIIIKKVKDVLAGWILFSVNVLCALVFVIGGLSTLSSLRTDFLSNANEQYYSISDSVQYIRYVVFAAFTVLLIMTNKLLKSGLFKTFSIQKIFSGCILHFFILILLSNELINLNILLNHNHENSLYYGSNAAYKLGFTCLWGIYSFSMIAWGIFKQNRIMRISAISLFGITLIKLVTFDTWDLSTGYKIIAFILLGVILLVVAFLYQKFKKIIFGEDDMKKEGRSAEIATQGFKS